MLKICLHEKRFLICRHNPHFGRHENLSTSTYETTLYHLYFQEHIGAFQRTLKLKLKHRVKAKAQRRFISSPDDHANIGSDGWILQGKLLDTWNCSRAGWRHRRLKRTERWRTSHQKSWIRFWSLSSRTLHDRMALRMVIIHFGHYETAWRGIYGQLTTQRLWLYHWAFQRVNWPIRNAWSPWGIVLEVRRRFWFNSHHLSNPRPSMTVRAILKYRNMNILGVKKRLIVQFPSQNA